MKYSYFDILRALRASGIEKGDTVFFTTGLGMLGLPPVAVDSQEKLNKMFLEAINEVLGEDGTILVPTYSYTFGKSSLKNLAVFDPQRTPAEIGSFPNYFLKQPGVIRSIDPMVSIAGCGPRAKEFLEDLPAASYGKGSPFSRLVKTDAKCCSLGLGPNWVPFIHYADWLYQVPFRYDKFFYGLLREGDATKPLAWVYSVRILAQESIADAHKVGRLAEEAGIWQQASLGRARIYTARCRDYFDFICTYLTKDKWTLATGPAQDPFVIEKKRVGEPKTKIELPSFESNQWLQILAPLRRDVVSENIDGIFDAISKHFPVSFNTWPSGSHVFGWIVPESWRCQEANITTLDNENIFSADADPNIVRSFSQSVAKKVSRQELMRHIDIEPSLAPFNYRDWGFSLPKEAVKKLKKSRYKVVIESDFYYGKLKTAELFLKGNSNQTVVFVGYVDGPNKVNENLSGAIGLLSLYQWLKNQSRRLNYIFLLLPGAIGWAAWLSKNQAQLGQVIGIVHLKSIGLPGSPMLFCSNNEQNLIREAFGQLLGEAAIRNKQSIFDEFLGKDNPLQVKINLDIPQHLFCLAHSAPEKLDTKIFPKRITESVNLLKMFINQQENKDCFWAKEHELRLVGKR
ncbi:DUF4910 domain-containing protein [Candidatus Margulisiibacteriota bacterium]